jgi:hypothetical protein
MDTNGENGKTDTSKAYRPKTQLVEYSGKQVAVLLGSVGALLLLIVLVVATSAAALRGIL